MHSIFLQIGLSFFFAFNTTVEAGYRVYKLKIKQLDTNGSVNRVSTVLTTLDQLQYEHYHGGFGRFKTALVDTWYCPGDTSHYRKYCSSPKIKPLKANGIVSQKQKNSSEPQKKELEIPYNRQPVIP